MITIDQSNPTAFYSRSQVSKLTGISARTLMRWQASGRYMPQSSTHRGRVKVWLYSEAQVEEMLQDPPYMKQGRPPKTKDVNA